MSWQIAHLLSNGYGGGVGAAPAGAEEVVGNGQDYVQVREVLPMVLHVMVVDPAEEPAPFKPAALGDVHAVMEVFKRSVVQDYRHQQADSRGKTEKEVQADGRRDMGHDQRRHQPPGQGELFRLSITGHIGGVAPI